MNIFYKLGELYFNSIEKFNVDIKEIQLDDNQHINIESSIDVVVNNKEVDDLLELIDDEIQMAQFDIAAELMKEPINEQKNIFENGKEETFRNSKKINKGFTKQKTKTKKT